MRIFCSADRSYVAVKLDLARISSLFLEVDVNTVARRIVTTRKLKVKPNDIVIQSASLFHVFPRADPRKPSNTIHILQALQSSLGAVVVQGLDDDKWVCMASTCVRACVSVSLLDKRQSRESVFICTSGHKPHAATPAHPLVFRQPRHCERRQRRPQALY